MKLVVVLAFCLAVVTTPPASAFAWAGYAGLIAAAGLWNWRALPAAGRRFAAALPILIALIALRPAGR